MPPVNRGHRRLGVRRVAARSEHHGHPHSEIDQRRSLDRIRTFFRTGRRLSRHGAAGRRRLRSWSPTSARLMYAGCAFSGPVDDRPRSALRLLLGGG